MPELRREGVVLRRSHSPVISPSPADPKIVGGGVIGEFFGVQIEHATPTGPVVLFHPVRYYWRDRSKYRVPHTGHKQIARDLRRGRVIYRPDIEL